MPPEHQSCQKVRESCQKVRESCQKVREIGAESCQKVREESAKVVKKFVEITVHKLPGSFVRQLC